MKRASSAAAWLALAVLAALFPILAPDQAFAAEGDYTIDELSTEVAVESNAAVHVIERQVVTFEQRNVGYIWYLHVPEDGESVRIASVRVAPVDDGGTVIGGWTRLQLVDSRPVLQGREPGDAAALSVRGARTQPWYSYNIGDGMIRCWFPIVLDAASRAEREKRAEAPARAEAAGEADEAGDDDGEGAPTEAVAHDESVDATRYLIEADYTVAHRVRVYRDVAELYWRYANSSLPTDASDVNLQVTLPVPTDVPIAPNVDVMAWGHGPDNGTLEVAEDGTVTCHVDVLERGNYAETHVIFPSWWLGNVAPGSANVFTELRQAAAIAEEAQWVDASKRGETWDFKVRVLFMAIAAAVMLAGVAAVARFGRSARSRRALVRAAATLAIVALGEQLFFREPVTTILLATLAVIVALVSLMLPQADEDDGDDGDGGGEDEATRAEPDGAAHE